MRVSDRDFKRFKNACERLCKLMGLQHYTRVYQQKQMHDTWATMCISSSSYDCTFTLTTAIDDNKDTYVGPEMLAIHECAHLLTERLYTLANKTGQYDSALLDDEYEMYARRFENMILGLLTPKQIKALGD